MSDTPLTPEAPPTVVHGMIAEFNDVDSIMHAAEAVRDAGYKKWDVHTSFPIHGIDEAMGIKPTILPWIVLACGLTGMMSGLVLTLYTMSTYFDVDHLPQALRGYEFFISGKPLAALPAYIPVVFETTILFSAFGAVFGMFGLNLLPQHNNPLFTSERFRRATADKFFVAIESRDRKFDAERSADFLRDLGATAVELIEDEA